MASKPRPKPDPKAPKKQTGYLWCDDCGASIPYGGFSEPQHGDGWPLHRCRSGIETFTRWTKDGPEIRSWL